MDNIKSFRADNSEEVNYSFDEFPIYVSKGLLSHCPDYRFPSHWHDDIELIAVLKGEMNYNVNGEIIKLYEGEGIAINSRQMHFGFSDSRLECEFICLLLHPMLLCVNAAYEEKFVFPIISDDRLAYIKLSQDIPKFKDIYNAIVYIEEIQKEKTAPLKIQSAFGYIWSLIFDNVSLSQSKKPIDSNLNTVKNMVKFINTNYSEKISLKDVAASGGVGESKCCRLFRRYLNTTPNDFIRQCRLNQSTKLLLNTDLSVTEISGIVGFNGSSYFAETFKKAYKVTPHEYRKGSAGL